MVYFGYFSNEGPRRSMEYSGVKCRGWLLDAYGGGRKDGVRTELSVLEDVRKVLKRKIRDSRGLSSGLGENRKQWVCFDISSDALFFLTGDDEMLCVNVICGTEWQETE